MNDLKNGILDINGFLVGPNTTVEELENHFGLKATRGQYRSHFDFGGQSFVSDGIEFKCNISLKQHVVEINLFPQLPELAIKYDLSDYSVEWLPYYQEIRVILDRWLEIQLGTPKFKDERVTEYKFGNILIGTDSYIDDRSPDFRVVGGTIDVFYR